MGPREFSLKCSLVEVLGSAAHITDYTLFTPHLVSMLDSGCASHKQVILLLGSEIHLMITKNCLLLPSNSCLISLNDDYTFNSPY